MFIKYIPWILATVLYAPIFKQLYTQRWETIDYTHAYFILPVSLWLVWRNRKKFSANPLSHRERGHGGVGWACLLTLGLLSFIFGWRQDYLLISSLSLIPVLFGLTGYLYGSGVAKALSFPILYLLLLVPPPLGVLDSITLPMRYGVSIVSTGILKLFHYPITRDGLLLYVGKHEVYMGAPCSGFRSLITMISLGLVYAYVIKGSITKKSLLLVSVIPLALLGNLARVIAICLATYYAGEAAGQKVHDYGGYVIFLVLIFGLMGLDSLLDRIKK